MAVTTTNSRKQYTQGAGGTTTDWPVDFKFSANADLVVITTVDGVDTTLELDTDYSVTGAGEDAGGTVTIDPPIAAGTRLTIYRETDLDQPTVLPSSGGWFPKVHEAVFDRIVMQLQQLYDAVERSIKLSPTSTDSAADLSALLGSIEENAAAAASSASTAATQAGLATSAKTAAVSARDDASDFADTASSGAGVITANLTAINNITANLTAIQGAAANASTASAKASEASASAASASSSAASAAASAASAAAIVNPSSYARAIGGEAYRRILGIVCPPSLEVMAYDHQGAVNGAPPGFTFSRASTATAYGPDGQLYTAEAGELRHEWDALTGEYKGWLLEGQATNLLLYSQDFTNAVWNKVNGLTTTASRLQAVSTSSTTYQNVPISADTQTRCFSWRVKKASTSTAVKLLAQAYGGTEQVYVVTLNPSTGDLSSVSVGGAYAVIDIGDAWLVYMTLTNNGTNTGVQLQVQPDVSAGTGYAEMAGVQLELGSYPTSYIPTTSAQVTRAMDVPPYLLTSGIPYNTKEGTLYAEFECLRPDTYGGAAIALDDGTGNNIIIIYVAADRSVAAIVVSGGSQIVYVGIAPSGTAVAGTNLRVAFAFKAGSYAVCCNGGAVQSSSASNTPPAVTTLRINSHGGVGNVNAHHTKHFGYFPRAISNTELQLLTK